MNLWVDALQEGRADEAVRLFLQEWHDWTPDDVDVDGRAPLPLSYFGPKVRRRLSFQNTFVIEQHEEGFIFYRENQANYEVLARSANEVLYVNGCPFSDPDDAPFEPVNVSGSLAHFLLKCMVYETAFGAGTKGAWGGGGHREYDAIIAQLQEVHQLGFWVCGIGRTRFFSGNGVVAYAESDHYGTWFYIGARDPARLSWLKRFEKLPWEDFDL